jgi:hypothetical protein
MKEFFKAPLRLMAQMVGILYCFYLSKIYPKNSLLLSHFKDKDVYILGSGSSVDDIDLTLINNSVVILLNSSYRRHTELRDKGNILIWFCVDMGRFKEISPLVPSDIPKIVSINWFVLRTISHLNLSRGDTFLMPKIAFKRDPRCGGYYGLMPKRPESQEDYWLDPSETTVFLPAHTVMLLAIMLSASLSPKAITLLGFDLGGAYASNTMESTYYEQPIYQTIRENIEHSLELILRNCQEKNIAIWNNSPRTKETILPKSSFLLKEAQ